MKMTGYNHLICLFNFNFLYPTPHTYSSEINVFDVKKSIQYFFLISFFNLC